MKERETATECADLRPAVENVVGRKRGVMTEQVRVVRALHNALPGEVLDLGLEFGTCEVFRGFLHGTAVLVLRHRGRIVAVGVCTNLDDARGGRNRSRVLVGRSYLDVPAEVFRPDWQERA